MTDNPADQAPRDRARRKAQNHFEVAEARTSLVKKLMEDERKATDAKTTKLRALRLAREEEDRLKAAAEPAPAPAEKKVKARRKATSV